MVLKQKGLMRVTMKNNRMNNDSRLGVLKKILVQTPFFCGLFSKAGTLLRFFFTIRPCLHN